MSLASSRSADDAASFVIKSYSEARLARRLLALTLVTTQFAFVKHYQDQGAMTTGKFLFAAIALCSGIGWFVAVRRFYRHANVDRRRKVESLVNDCPMFSISHVIPIVEVLHLLSVILAYSVISHSITGGAEAALAIVLYGTPAICTEAVAICARARQRRREAAVFAAIQARCSRTVAEEDGGR